MLTSNFVSITFLFISNVVLIKSQLLFSSEMDGWFKLHETPATWHNASVECHNEDAVLASPTNFLVSLILRSLMTRSSVDRIHLGMNTSRSENNIMAHQGTPLRNMYTMDWATQYENEETEDCLTFSSDLKVNTESCEQLLPYVCYIKKSKSLTIKTEIYETDMNTEMKQYTVNFATLASKKSNEDLAEFMVLEFGRKYSGTWQCIVGNEISSYITYEEDSYIQFSLGERDILLFKTQ